MIAFSGAKSSRSVQKPCKWQLQLVTALGRSQIASSYGKSEKPCK
jgi:hypothetical protein